MINEILTDSENKMNKSLDALSCALARIRTGRPHPDILSNNTSNHTSQMKIIKF